MTRRAAGLLSCTAAVALALMVVSLQVGGQQKAPAAPPAGSGPRPAAKAPAVTPYELAAMSYAQRFAVLCAPCHGANGRIETPLTPVLAGQPSLYVITQLFLFREKQRVVEIMKLMVTRKKIEKTRSKATRDLRDQSFTKRKSRINIAKAGKE